MRFMVTTHSSNEHWNGDIDYAIIDVTPEDIRQRAGSDRSGAQDQ